MGPKSACWTVGLSIALLGSPVACTAPHPGPGPGPDHDSSGDSLEQVDDPQTDVETTCVNRVQARAGYKGPDLPLPDLPERSLPGDAPPVADAGFAVQTRTTRGWLDASGSFDPEGAVLEHHWRQLRGPAPALIHDPNSIQTLVDLPVPGHYRFRLRVSDGVQLRESDVLIVRRHPSAPPRSEFVIHISVDGLRADAVSLLGPGVLPAMHRLRDEGSFTDNARADYDFTITVPNHIAQLTGRFVVGPHGHGYDFNWSIAQWSLHQNVGRYIPSIFGTVHDHGLNTAYFATKTKMDVIHASYGRHHGAVDRVLPDDGTGKIDFAWVQPNLDLQVETLEELFARRPPEYTFFHLSTPDEAGHVYGWDLDPDSAYAHGVRMADAAIGQILDQVEHNPVLREHTTIIMTTDHGGHGLNHLEAWMPVNYTIPFYVWGAGVLPGTDLYGLNTDRRSDPGSSRNKWTDARAPIRNADAANLAARLLRVPLVAGSTINVTHPLVVGLERFPSADDSCTTP